MNPCVAAGIHVLGLGALWAVAIAICVGTGPAVCVAALIAAGIITLFDLPSFWRAVNGCFARRRR